ncbi:metal-dependent hydrolase family protein [Sulfobacillus harzensis]|uniref:Amidohydrolase family protein n=1 Tax=Sulfobacillus harzensis TaxID=2729629 RepID=A0A7Y0L3E6_9FIRM|nr:amidohydrolase family protein [Sulfobacillus harzensis]NMP22237.1 amidohydrolase family protein [Sulfobacillus harzensis]
MRTAIYHVMIVNPETERVAPGTVLIGDDGGIEAVQGPGDPPSESSVAVLDGGGLYLLPGLIDAHVHLRSDAVGNRDMDAKLTAADFMARALMNARITLERGITAVRDAGSSFGIGVAVRRAVEAGWHPGPHVRTAGEPFSITGGHGDPQNSWPSHVHWETGTIVDSADDARRAARRQVRDKVDFLKFMASGGVSSVGDKSTEIGLGEEEMRAAIDVARNAGIRTMAHAQAEQAIDNAIRAGVDSIEHGFYLSDWAIETMAARGIALVPTLSAMVQILQHESQVAPTTVEKAKLARDAHFASVQRAYAGGVPIVMGTDAGTPFNFHGENAQELVYLSQAGLSMWDSLKAATSAAARLLDLPTGRLQSGYWADLTLWAENPAQDLGVLLKADAFKGVVQRGRVVRWEEPKTQTSSAV